MLGEPSTFTVVPLDREAGRGNSVGLGDWAKTGSVNDSDSSLGVAANAKTTAESLISVFLGCIFIPKIVFVRSEP
jgi:hypothetical protein